jgi:hypothetical protein
VTLSQVTTGLVDWYPLDVVITNGATLTTPDCIGGRDMILVNMNASNLLSSTRPSLNSASVSNCLNFSQAGGLATIMYYDSKGQNPLDGSGDFLPFCNQVNASMNLWIKLNATVDSTHGYRDKRFFGEADDGSSAGTAPLWLFGADSSGSDPGGGLNNNGRVHFVLRNNTSSAAFESYSYTPQTLVDGTQQSPDFSSLWQQGDDYTAGNPLDGSWHMFTFTIDSNREVDIYIDGVRDPGPGAVGGIAWTNMYGGASYGLAMPLTNLYYTTNIYPSAGVSNPPPTGFVRWVWNGMFKRGVTAFGGFRRQGGNSGGFPMLLDDIGFWNRKLSAEEIQFVYTNGVYTPPPTEPPHITFNADFSEVAQGDYVTLRWNAAGASTNPGGIVISGVGDVSALGVIGSTNVFLAQNQTYNFTITVHNGISPDTNMTLSVKTLGGVDSRWHLVQRFDGVFVDSSDGIFTNNWMSVGGNFFGSFDRWNTVTLTNGGGLNRAITPRTGDSPNPESPTGYDSRGALSYAKLGSLTIPPGQTNTLFFRFSLRETPTGLGPGKASDLDFGAGLSDLGFIAPCGGMGYYAGSGGGVGPYFSILRNSGGQFTGGPFNLFATDRDEVTGTVTNTFSYTASVDPQGLQTNVNYLVWMDIENYNTHIQGGTSTVQEAVYSVWLQKQGEPTRRLLVSRFHGNRDYVAYNPVNDTPTPYLDKVFFNIGTESISNFQAGAYIATNMIAVDDIYLSKAGVNSAIPKLLDITSIIRAPGSVTLKWDSLGSLFQTNTYQVQRASQLTNPDWTTIATVPSGGDSTTYADNSVGANTSACYRIVWP